MVADYGCRFERAELFIYFFFLVWTDHIYFSFQISKNRFYLLNVTNICRDAAAGRQTSGRTAN